MRGGVAVMAGMLAPSDGAKEKRAPRRGAPMANK